jgi:hypothetical protein
MPVQIKKSGGSSFLSMSLSGNKGKGKKRATKASARKGELEEFTRQLSTMLSTVRISPSHSSRMARSSPISMSA